MMLSPAPGASILTPLPSTVRFFPAPHSRMELALARDSNATRLVMLPNQALASRRRGWCLSQDMFSGCSSLVLLAISASVVVLGLAVALLAADKIIARNAGASRDLEVDRHQHGPAREMHKERRQQCHRQEEL